MSLSLTTLVSFNGTNGADAIACLTINAAGDLFGTTYGGGASGEGTVSEITKTGNSYSTLITLVSFDGTNGATPTGSLTPDAAGDLFGTTDGGGASNDGTVFEIARTGNSYSMPITLVSFSGTNGAGPEAGLTTDATGDLFGTTEGGGASNDGTVFEIARTDNSYSAPITLVSFNGTNNEVPIDGLITDAAGDLFGTTESGASGDGAVFEIPKTGNSYSTPITVASFNANDMVYPEGSLTIDAAGDLFGTTFWGGAGNDGMVFEIPKTGNSYGTPITLLSFNGANGVHPSGMLTPDAAGDLFGTTLGGIYNIGGWLYENDSTVFEITGSGFVVPAPTAPSISGTKSGQATTDEAAVTPFSGVTIADTNSGATDTLTIALSAPGGTLTGAGLTKGAAGVYKLTGTAAAIITELDALSFTPTAGAPFAVSTTTFTLSDKSSAFATATTDSTTTVIDTDPPPGFIIGPQLGSGVITGIAGADIIVAFGYGNTINSVGGNDTISAGLGNATVSAGGGNDLIVLGGYDNSVTAGNGNDLVSGALGNTSVTLGNGNDNVQVGGYDNTVKLGNGNDALTGPGGNAFVSVGNGNDSITLGGYSDTITLGNGADRVSGTQGLAFIIAGSGNDTIELGGYGNTVDAGGGTNIITGGIGNDTFVLGEAGKGFDLISNFTETNGDVLNLTAALAATRWNGLSSTLGDYLKVTDSGGGTTLSVASSGSGAGTAVAELSGAGSLGLSDLFSHHSLLT